MRREGSKSPLSRTQTYDTLEYGRLQTNHNIENIQALNGILWIMTDWKETYCYFSDTDQIRIINDGVNQLQIKHVAMKNDSTFFADTPNSIIRITFAGTNYAQDKIEISEIPFKQFLQIRFSTLV